MQAFLRHNSKNSRRKIVENSKTPATFPTKINRSLQDHHSNMGSKQLIRIHYIAVLLPMFLTMWLMKFSQSRNLSIMGDLRYILYTWSPASYYHCESTADSAIEIREERRKWAGLGSALAVVITGGDQVLSIYNEGPSFISIYIFFQCWGSWV